MTPCPTCGKKNPPQGHVCVLPEECPTCKGPCNFSHLEHPHGEPFMPLCVAFDIDGTLITEDGFDRPKYDVIALLVWFANAGHRVICWSGGGKSYAEMVVRRLGLDHLVEVREKGNADDADKPDIAFDDCEARLGKVNVKVPSHP